MSQRRKTVAVGKMKAKKGGKKKFLQQRRSISEERSLYNSNLLRGRDSMIAPELIEVVPITVTVGGATAGAVAFVDNSVKINSLADAAWTGITPGLGTYNEIYASYRVIGCQMELSACSKHTAGVNAGYLFTDTAAATGSAAGVLASTGLPYAGLRLLSAATAGKPVVTFRKKVWFADLVGSDSVLTDDDYSAATNAVADPANLIYLRMMSATQTGNFAANGDCAFTLKIALIVKFFNRQRVLV